MNMTSIAPLTFFSGLVLAGCILGAMQLLAKFALWREGANAGWAKFSARAADWWLVLGAIGFAYSIGPGALILAFALASFMALREVVTATPVKPSDANPLFIAFFIATPGQYLLLSARAYGMFSIFIPVYIFFAMTALAAFAKDKGDFLARTSRIQWAIMVTVYGVSFAPALLTLSADGGKTTDGMMLFFFLFAGQMSETMQFLGTKAIGRRHPIPSRPDLSAEGVGIAIASSFGIGAAMSPATLFSWWQAGLAGVAISAAGFVGTVALSAAKESLGIKRWRPSQEARGGMMERVDAICFSAPIFFQIARVFYPH